MADVLAAHGYRKLKVLAQGGYGCAHLVRDAAGELLVVKELLKQPHKLIIVHQVDLMKPKITQQPRTQIEVFKLFKVRVCVLVEKILNKRKL
jgi:hypothetical protein